MLKKILIACIIGISILCHGHGTQESASIRFDKELNLTIQRALSFTITATDCTESTVAHAITDQAFKQVMNCDYETALVIVFDGLEQLPYNFELQSDLAALVGDYSETCSGEIKDLLAQKSRELFDTLLERSEEQQKYQKYRFKNEYFFRFAQYKNQYENGLSLIAQSQLEEIVSTSGKGYYYQGVGAARHAMQLYAEGSKVLACEYARKAMVSWAQYFTYKNDYYNAYVHYAITLGVLGYKEEMMRALLRSASFINKDLTYFEFKEIIDFFESLNL